MVTKDYSLAISEKRRWGKDQRLAMIRMVQAKELAEAWIRGRYSQDPFFLIKLRGVTGAKGAVKTIRGFWKRRFQFDPECFPDTVRMWLIIAKDPKNPVLVDLFCFVRGVKRKFHGLLKDLLSEEVGKTRILNLADSSFPKAAEWFCGMHAEELLLDLVPLEFNARYRPSWRLREI